MQLTRLGPYEIDKPLGKGGMGSVFAATDVRTGQRVAIKALTPHLAMAEGFRERFEAEIESLKTLKHDGIVRLYGYGEQDGVLFYSMELVEGISLEDELKAGRRFNWREVTSIAIQLSLALKHAHDHGIVHRDIKPANILLFDDDHVKLADFGIARLFGNTQLTTAGGVLGTADYMSPEQADGRPVTPRCDQYSLGGVMYALLAGRPPFYAKNLPQMLQLQRFAQPEPVRRYAPETPEQLERLIMQLLAKDPADRFPNTQILARHLQAMAIALSRPASDDFALEGDHSASDGRDAAADQLLAIEKTQAEIPPPPPLETKPAAGDAGNGRSATSGQDAATLAAEVLAAKQATASAPESILLTTDSTVPPLPARPTHFTTVEEEQARLSAQHQRSWILMAVQLASIAAVLGGMGALAMYLSRPPSANDLYETISTKVENDYGSLLNIESEVDEFLALYPDDPRSDELRAYKERIDLDRFDRQLERDARGSASIDAPLLPAEQLYRQAIGKLQSDPDEAMRLLNDLIALYGTDASDKANAAADSKGTKPAARERTRTAAIVEFAKRRMATLKADLDTRRKRLLESLAERLEAAARLSGLQPEQAAAMYRAIIDLHAGDDWAKEKVDVARNRLDELEKN